jgi:hypothetical protein
MTRKHIGLSVAILIMGLTGTAVATTTVCSTSAYKQYHYGRKASLRFDVGRQGPESLTNDVKEFAAKNALSYSSVGGHDPYKDPPLESLDQILQDTSIALTIIISTSNRNTIATVELTRFSGHLMVRYWRCSRWPIRVSDMRRSLNGRWSIWCAAVAVPRRLRKSSGQQPGRSRFGSGRRSAMRAKAMAD